MTSKVVLYWETLRHLKAIQFYGRIWFRLMTPRPDLAPAPEIRERKGRWCAPAPRNISLIDKTEFLFLGERGQLHEVGWDGPQREKLWRYNQHYFDDLNARDSESRTCWHAALLEDWVAKNEPGIGTGWEPYPTSLRIVNWIKWVFAGNSLPNSCIQSLAIQTRWLRKRLEIHLLGNHLFANAKALVFAGLFFDGPEAKHWLASGIQIISREVQEQVLADGGHFERSTMYHALVLEDVFDLCNILTCCESELTKEQRELSENCRDLSKVMLSWLRTMCHPDGDISFFNDAALGIASTLAELTEYANRLSLPSLILEEKKSHWLVASGYARLEAQSAVALLDLAPVGPDYLPGHAHADTLSFEFSVHGRRVLVNSGTSCYGLGIERLRQRGTAAHNTVTVCDENSSEVWSGFRVARRARVLMSEVIISRDRAVAKGAHDGYTRLSRHPVHQRCWDLHGASLTIEDIVSDGFSSAKARFHFHPAVTLVPSSDATQGLVVLPDGQRMTWFVGQGEATLESSTWHPSFGVTLENYCLSVSLVKGRSLIGLEWSAGY